jgi:phage regulator Rha-like protein
MQDSPTPQLNAEYVASRIVMLRGNKALLDADLAQLYGVSTKRLNEQVRRNQSRFPRDFLFRLTKQELANLRSQIATSSLAEWGGRRYPPYAFTEHGALMAANILNSPRAIEVSIYVVRAFIRLRATIATHKELARKLDELERRTAELASKHDALASDTKSQLTQVIAALRQLMSRPEPTRRPIGFVTPR